MKKGNFIYSDGGRAEAGFKGNTGDCVVRAIAIASDTPYKQIYDDINLLAKDEKVKKGSRSSSRDGVFKKTYHKYLLDNGFEWISTMFIGQGCKVHVKAGELPKGRLILRLSKHLTAFVDGVIYDTFDPSREGTRCVYGYYKKIKQ